MSSPMLLPEFEQETAVTRRLLERLPDEHLAWKPHEKSFSLGDLATHLANIPSWTATTLDEDGIDMAAGFTPPPTGDRARILATFDENVAAAREKLAGVTDEVLGATWTLRTGDVEHFTLPKSVVLRNFVLNHLVHHRAQLSVYLRLLDVPVPSIYGPSADESGM